MAGYLYATAAVVTLASAIAWQPFSGLMSSMTYGNGLTHLNRPVLMTDGSKAAVWQATWLPFGGPQAITGTATLDARFPGQWFQLESGLHQNWWRHYDPTTGRYTQVDPLGFVDGPSVYGYAGQNALVRVDPRGLSPGQTWGDWLLHGDNQCSGYDGDLSPIPVPPPPITMAPGRPGLADCLNAGGSTGSRERFCASIPGDARRARCYEHVHESPQDWYNYCYGARWK